MTTKDKILSCLRKSEGYVSGEILSERFDISRSAVCKNIKILRSCGYGIQSVTNRGYKLISCPDILSSAEIEAGLATDILAKKIYCYDLIDSTNEEAKRQGLGGAPNGSLFIAEQQDGGKGRLGRAWASPPKAGLWFSVLLRPGLIPAQLTSVTLLAGLAVCSAIRTVTGCSAMIKWPNDIVIGSKKVCGILTEMAAEIDRVNYVVVGIGINVNNISFPEELQVKATSLQIETGASVDRVRLLQEVLSSFERLLEKDKSDSPALLEEYKRLCISLNRRVGFSRNSNVLSGTATDISAEGELIVQCDDGSVIPVSSGEVTVQGIYGQ